MKLKNRTKQMISAAFAVLCAVGNRRRRAVGVAAITARITDAEQSGTLSTRAGDVRDALTGGNGRIVCAACVLPRTKSGMRTRLNKNKLCNTPGMM